MSEPVFSNAYRTEDFPLWGRNFLEASAGTGKTHSIQGLFARVLLESARDPSRRRLGVEEVLVVTFTEKATQELKERLRAVLAKLRDAIRGRLRDGGWSAEARADMEAYLGLPAESWDGCLSKAAALLGDALADFDAAAIFTIHGFCERLRQQHSVELAANPDAELGGSASDALQDLALQWIRTHRERAAALGIDPDPGKHGFAAAYLSPISQHLPETSRIDLPPDGGATPPDPAAERLRIAAGLLSSYRAAAPDRTAISFDDLLWIIRDVLRNPARAGVLRAALLAEYRVVFIDEFQDTDPFQYEIFRRAFFPDGPLSAFPAYFVGDPKQAIYAFRGGDVFTYRRALGDTLEAGGGIFRLGKNWRSVPALVDAVNRLFADPSGGPPLCGDGIPYGAPIDADPAKLPLLLGDTPDTTPLHLVAASGDNAIFAAIADRVDALLRPGAARIQTASTVPGAPPDVRALAPGDIAVLLPTNGAIRAVQSLLADRGLHAVASSAASVFSTDEAGELLDLCRAILNPRDTGLFRWALLRPLVGFGIHDAILVAKGEKAKRPAGCRIGGDGGPVDFDALFLWFGTLRECWEKRGILAALSRLLGEGGILHRLSSPDGERALTNYFHLFDLLHRAEAEGHLAPAALLSWLENRRRRPDDSNEAEQLHLDSDAQAVQLLTIHKSKGLEFPVVFVGIPSDAFKLPRWNKQNGRLNGRDDAVEFYHGDDGVITAFNLSSADRDAPAAVRFRREKHDEFMRLLYVALTRARHHCQLVWNSAPASPNSKSVSADVVSALLANGGIDPDAPAVFPPFAVENLARQPSPTVPDSESPNPPPPAPAPPRLPPPPAPPAAWQRVYTASYSSLTDSPSATPPERDGADLDAPGPAVFPPVSSPGTPSATLPPVFSLFRGGDVVGTAFHALFERISFQTPPDALDAPVRAILAENGLLPTDPEAARDAVAAARDMFVRTLALPLEAPGGDTFALADIPDADRVAEWEFVYPHASRAIRLPALRDILEPFWRDDPGKAPWLERLAGLSAELSADQLWMKGYIDLLFRRRGRYYVVDWKSNALGGSPDAFSPARLREEMATHFYFVQYLLYSAVLHAHLRRTLPGYDPARHFGGVRYVFLRGACIPGASPDRAVFSDLPPPLLLDRLAVFFGLPAPP